MGKTKRYLLFFIVIISSALCTAKNEMATKQDGDIPIVIIEHIGNTGLDKSSYISASINGHSLTVVILDDIGHVTIKITDTSGSPIDVNQMETPSGLIFFIPSVGNYMIVFTLSNGDEYYGEFTVTD